jgi:hypothetical protein
MAVTREDWEEEGNSTDLTNSKKSNENTKNTPSVNES